MPTSADDVARVTLEQIRAHLRELRHNPLKSAPRLSPEELLIRQTLTDVAMLYRTVGTLEKALAAAQLQFDDPFAFEYELAEEALREAEKTIEIVRAHWTQMPPKLRTGLNLEAQ